jgi:hypothetical protein
LIIKGSIFEEDNTETIKFPLTYNALGRLLSSSLACVLAKATGKAIIIENERIIEEEKITKIEYLMVEE